MMAEKRFFLGVDGGQSSTRAVIADASGRVLARGTAGPCGHALDRAGRAGLKTAVARVVADALNVAGLPVETEFEAGCFGLSGGPDGKLGLISEVVRTGMLRVVTDAEVALEGAAAGGAGAIVIAGTGCIALARNGRGGTFRCRGWGHLFGDEYGAFGIVRSALQHALAAEEGWGHETPLADMFRDAAGADSVHQALHRFYGPDWPRDRIAGLAPAVDAAAEAGDGCATVVLRTAGEYLADMAVAAAERLPPHDMSLPAHYTGGVFRSRTVLRIFRLHCERKGCVVASPLHDAAIGALLLAYGSAGVGIRGQDLRCGG